MWTRPGNQWRTSHLHQRLLPNSTVTTQTRRTNTEGPKEKSRVLNYLNLVPINFHLFILTTSISLAWYNLRHGRIANPYHASPPLCPCLPHHCAPHTPHALTHSHYRDGAFHDLSGYMPPLACPRLSMGDSRVLKDCAFMVP